MRNARVRSSRLGASACLAFALVAMTLLGATPAAATTACTSPPQVIPVDQLSPGMTGTGYTTLTGTSPTSFSFRIVGVIPDGLMLGLDAIVIQITGPSSFLDQAGGMFFGISGSPAYVNGKLAGATSYLFWDDPTFGILTPAQSMLDLLNYVGTTPTLARRVPMTEQVRRAIAEAEGVPVGDVTGSFQPIPTPLGVAGASERQIKKLQRKLDRRGESFFVYSAAATSTTAGTVNPVQFTPGQPLGVAIAYGDAAYYATGTATIACGDYVVAFGHSFFYDAPGPISLGLSGASGMAVLKGAGYPGYRLALLTDPRGTVVQDRFAGVVGQIGVAPPSTSIVTDFTSPDTGVSRVGTTEAIHTWGWWLESIVWSHVWSNFAAVYQGYPSAGSSSMNWTIEGTADGAPFTVENRGMFYSDWDATSTLYKLLSTIDYLQFNEFTEGPWYAKVAFTSIESDGMITAQQREGNIVNVRTSSSLEPKLKSRAVTKVKAGSTLTVEVTIAPVDGSPEVVTTMDVKIPHSAKGYHTFTVRGGKDRPWLSLGDVYSFEDLVAQLSGGEHRNDLIVSGVGSGGIQELDWMPKGRYSFDVQAV